jgi:hypothetical protein
VNRDIDLGTVYQGADADFQFFLFEDGRPMPVHPGDEVSIGFLLKNTSVPLITRNLSDGNITRSGGTVSTSLSEEETENLVAGKYLVVVVFTSGSSGKENEIFRGDFKVVESMA